MTNFVDKVTHTQVAHKQARQHIVLEVAIAIPIRQTYDYLADASLLKLDKPNDLVAKRVQVPFGRGHKIGVICEVKQTSDYAYSQLKHIDDILDDEPLFDGHLWATLQWLAKYYLGPIGEVISLALPVALRLGKHCKPQEKKIWVLTSRAKHSLFTELLPSDSSEDNRIKPKLLDESGLADEVLDSEFKNAPVQKFIIQKLVHQSYVCADDFVDYKSGWRQAIKSLISKEWVQQEQIEQTLFSSSSTQGEQVAFQLTSQQQEVVRCMQTKIHQGGFQCHLLHGVTGSGKTHVYFELIRQVVEQQKQVLLLVPEIGLTPQVLQRTMQCFDYEVAVFHSGLNESERHQNWFRAMTGKSKIIIGTRSAVFASLPNLGLIVVDEEHDASYKQQQGIFYQARDVAVFRAKQASIPILLGSATPSLESYFNANQKRYEYHYLSQRATNVDLPHIQLIDLNTTPCVDGIATLLLDQIGAALEQGQQAMLFLNRRGFAPAMYCADCKSVARCQRCDSNLTIHKQSNIVRCHHCGYQAKVWDKCKQCQSENLLFLGEGTQKLEGVIEQRFPQARVLRLDKDSTRKKGYMQQSLEKIQKHKVDIIVGTQLISKGHDFPHLGLVGVVNADQGLYSTDFRAMEALFQQLVQVAGRAGRHGQIGKVYIQTNFPNHPFFNYVKSQDYHLFAESSLQERQQVLFPPFYRFAIIRCESTKKYQGLRFLEQLSMCLKADLNDDNETWVMSPVSAPMEKRAGKFRYQLLISAKERKKLHHTLEQVTQLIRQQKKLNKMARSVRWKIDVDPYDLY